VLDLNHHGQQIADVEAGDHQDAVVFCLLVDDVDAVVLLLEPLGSLEELIERELATAGTMSRP